MRTRLSLFCDKVIEAGWLAALVVVPIYFNIYSQRVFEPDKLSLLRSIALVMAVAWVVRVVEDWRSNAERDSDRPRTWRRLVDAPMVLPTLLLVVVYLISTILSVSPSVSFLGSYQRLQGTYTTLSYIVIFFLVMEGLRTRRQLDRLITVAIVVSFPVAAYGLVQHFDLDPLPWGGNVTTRVAANMGNAIFVAAYLIMIVPLTLSRLLANWKAAAGDVSLRDGLLGFLSSGLLSVTTIALVMLRRGAVESWLGYLALSLGIVLQVPIFLLSSAERRRKILSVGLPLVFAFVVGLAWLFEVTLEVLGLPVGAAEAEQLFRYGALFAVVFVAAMASFSFFLRKPLSRLLLLAAYFIILITQLAAIVYAQSRGPLLGLLAGIFAYMALLGLVRRQVWLTWLTAALAGCAVVFLVLFNTVESSWLDRLREVPDVGRLGKVLQTEEGTGKVRVLIWEGAAEMITWHAPLQYPGEDGGPDPFNALRPVIGYGPESMYVAYNRFYPPELAHYEKRNASPDRSHNETFDALVMTGVLGFVVYMVVFSSVFYYGLKWLGVLSEKWATRTFLGLWIAGGLIGAVGAWLWGGVVYVGVGIPGGMIVGLGLTLAVVAAMRTFGTHESPGTEAETSGPYTLWVVALFAAVLAHFVEIHFGIAIAATRTYFWVYVALLVAIGQRLRSQRVGDGPHAGAGVQVAAGCPRDKGRDGTGGASRSRGRRRRRDAAEEPRSRRPATTDLDWRGSLLVLTLVTILVLGTMLFNSITLQRSRPLPESLRDSGTDAEISQWRDENPSGLWGNIWYSLTIQEDDYKPVMMVMILATWGMLGLVFLSELAASGEGGERSPSEWLAACAAIGGAALVGTGLFAVVHASHLKLSRVSLGRLLDRSVPLANPLASTITTYYLFLLFIILGTALGLTFLFRRVVASNSRRSLAEPASLAVLATVILGSALACVAIYLSNINIVRADIFYKQGLSYENARQWDVAVRYYEEALDIAPNQDFYYLFLGRALMEGAKELPAEQREEGFSESEQALQKARQIAPLNTDHSANLARLYRTWGGLSSGTQSAALLQRALAHYVDANSLSPNNAQILNEWGQTYLAMGDIEAGLGKYDESLALDPEFGDTYMRLGEFYTLQEDWEQAAEAYERAVALKPKSAQAYSTLGYVYSKLGDMDAALEAYIKAVELKPKNYSHRRNLAVIYRELGRAEDAIREAYEALDLAPADEKQMMRNLLAELGVEGIGLSTEETQLLQQFLDQGWTYLEAEEWEAAEPYYLQALELDPDNAKAHIELAYAYAQMGRIDDAIEENLSVSQLQPLDYGSHMNLAILYREKGDLTRAIEEAEIAISRAPNDTDRANLELFLEQLRALEVVQTRPTPEPGATGAVPRAGDLAPEQRAGMYADAPAMTIDPNDSFQATISTSKGSIIVELDAASAPKTVNNFVYLARQGYYDGLTFHRVEENPAFALIQGGDPLGSGTGGPGYTVEAEIGLPHDQGAIAMARLGDQVNPERASSGSQFYICLVPIHQLDGGYTVFGYVVEGLDVAERITVGDQILSVAITED